MKLFNLDIQSKIKNFTFSSAICMNTSSSPQLVFYSYGFHEGSLDEQNRIEV